MLLLFSCRSPFKSKGNYVPTLQGINGEEVWVQSPLLEGKILYLNDEKSETLLIKTFQSTKEAQSYAMERRMLLLRKFERLVEPYFGTANAKECGRNLSYSPINTSDKSFLAVVQLLSKGNDRIIHDCLLINNTHWLKVEFITCGSTFHDYRSYIPLSKSKPDPSADFKCRENSK